MHHKSKHVHEQIVQYSIFRLLFGTAQDTRYGVEVKQVSILIVLLYLCATEEEKKSGLSLLSSLSLIAVEVDVERGMVSDEPQSWCISHPLFHCETRGTCGRDMADQIGELSGFAVMSLRRA